MEFKDLYLTCDELADMIKQCVSTNCDHCETCPLYDEEECRDTLLYNCKAMIQRFSEAIKDKSRTIIGLQNELIIKDERIKELEQELEERCNSCELIPDQDPQNYDLMQIVDEIADACTALVQHKRIRPVTLMRYIEDVIHDRERRRVWNPDTEEME